MNENKTIFLHITTCRTFIKCKKPNLLDITNYSEGYFLMESEIYSISEELMLGKGDNLFDHIASCLAGFIVQYNLGDLTLPLGFTFSFPLIQDGLAQGSQYNREYENIGLTNILQVVWLSGRKGLSVLVLKERMLFIFLKKQFLVEAI